MGQLSLTDPVNETTADATLIATNNAAIKAVVNGGLDDSNVAADAGIDPSKLANYPDDATKFLRGDGMWTATTNLEIAYVEFTATVTATTSTETGAVTVASAGAQTFDGATKVRVEFFAPNWEGSDNTNGGVLTLFDGDTSHPIGQFAKLVGIAAAGGPILAARELTPSAATHTYFVGILDAGSVSGTHSKVFAGAGGSGTLVPGFIKITKAL